MSKVRKKVALVVSGCKEELEKQSCGKGSIPQRVT